MAERIAIIGAGVSGLTCGVVLAEHGYHTAIFAKEIGQQTTSSVAAAVWFPYHVEPAERVIPLALETYQVLLDIARFPESGVSIIESRQFLRTGEIEIPDWAIPLGAQRLSSVATGLWPVQNRAQRGGYSFKSGFSLRVPLMDTTIYLDYLAAALSQGWRRNPRERPLRKARRCRYTVRPRPQLRRNRGARTRLRSRSGAASRPGSNRPENRGSFLRDRL